MPNVAQPVQGAVVPVDAGRGEQLADPPGWAQAPLAQLCVEAHPLGGGVELPELGEVVGQLLVQRHRPLAVGFWSTLGTGTRLRSQRRQVAHGPVRSCTDCDDEGRGGTRRVQ